MIHSLLAARLQANLGHEVARQVVTHKPHAMRSLVREQAYTRKRVDEMERRGKSPFSRLSVVRTCVRVR